MSNICDTQYKLAEHYGIDYEHRGFLSEDTSIGLSLKKTKMVIGVSRFDDMREHMIDCDGSYFRQFLLVSNGELPPPPPLVLIYMAK